MLFPPLDDDAGCTTSAFTRSWDRMNEKSGARWLTTDDRAKRETQKRTWTSYAFALVTNMRCVQNEQVHFDCVRAEKKTYCRTTNEIFSSFRFTFSGRRLFRFCCKVAANDSFKTHQFYCHSPSVALAVDTFCPSNIVSELLFPYFIMYFFLCSCCCPQFVTRSVFVVAFTTFIFLFLLNFLHFLQIFSTSVLLSITFSFYRNLSLNLIYSLGNFHIFSPNFDFVLLKICDHNVFLVENWKFFFHWIFDENSFLFWSESTSKILIKFNFFSWKSW